MYKFKVKFDKKCIVCGNEFIAHQPYAKYCSNSCRHKGQRIGLSKESINKRKISDEEIIQAIEKGLSRTEIAEKYGVHVNNLQKRMERLGVHASYKHYHEKIFGECWHYVSSQDMKAKEKCPEFDYLEGRKKNGDYIYRLKCKHCGNIITRTANRVRIGNIQCEICAKENNDQKENKDLQRERIKLMRFFIALGNSKTERICPCCGISFFSQYGSCVYCSEKCKRKAKRERFREKNPEKYKERVKKHRNHGNRHISRAKKYGCDYEYGITLAKVIAKDNNICQICGEPCDRTSKEWGSAGLLYPSIDHIVPLSRGGSHTWDNVQLAHLICNSYKSDNTVKREEVWT